MKNKTLSAADGLHFGFALQQLKEQVRPLYLTKALRDFGRPWQTVWKRHARFCKDGTRDRMLTALLVEADAAGEIDWNVSVDSTVSRVHQHGATAARSELKPTSHTGGSIE